MFHGLITPVIDKLSERFDIFVMTTNFYLNDNFSDQLEHWKNEGTIFDYLIVPMCISNSTSDQNTYKEHLFMKFKLNYLRKQKFDLVILGSSQSLWERYLLDCTLTHKCIRIGLVTGGFCLLLHPPIIEGILSGEKASDLIMKLANSCGYKQKISIKDNPIRKVFSKFIKSSSKLQFSKRGIIFVLNRLYVGIKFLFSSIFIDRYIIPAFLVFKIFSKSKYEDLTYFDTDYCDSIIVFQKLHELVFRSICSNAHVYLTQSPLVGSCRCCLSQPSEFDKVLVCLTGYEVTNDQQELLYRDLQIVMLECGAKEVHIKPHPRERGSHVERLQSYFQEKGIATTIIGVDKPIRDIVCDYIGVVGYVSGSLFEARSACNYAFVVGFVAVSQIYVKNAKHHFGDIDNLEKRIDWIEEDGTYNPDIFRRRYHPAPPYPTIPEILTEIVKNSKK